MTDINTLFGLDNLFDRDIQIESAIEDFIETIQASEQELPPSDIERASVSSVIRMDVLIRMIELIQVGLDTERRNLEEHPPCDR